MDEVNETGILLCNFSGMIKNVLPSLRQRAGSQRICSRQKSIRSGTAGLSWPGVRALRMRFYAVFALTGRRRAAVCRGRLTDRSAAGRHSGSDTPERCRPGQSVH